ncbi:MAG: hypothetical protein ABJE66_12230 [Deltaproteobacteria bacterium]
MGDSPISPKVLRGAIVGLDLFNPLASLVVFQYNPENIRRTITPNSVGGQTGQTSQAEALRLVGPPTEAISADIELDATDQLEAGSTSARLMGIHPVLASLEMLVYPKSALVIANEILATAGIIEVVPPEAPLTLFIWGPARVVPVRIDSMTVTEDEFDTMLNPIRAKIGLQMRVLNYRDLGLTSAGGALFMVHQVLKETMATINGIGNVVAGATTSISVVGSL